MSWGKNKVFLAKGTVLPVSFASRYCPPTHKSKNLPLYGKGSARADLAERWKMAICQVSDGHLLDQKDRQPGSYKTSFSCLGRNLQYIKPQTDEKHQFFQNIQGMLGISVGQKVSTTNLSYLIHQSDNAETIIIISHSTFPLLTVMSEKYVLSFSASEFQQASQTKPSTQLGRQPGALQHEVNSYLR